jgi:hypothetical protein
MTDTKVGKNPTLEELKEKHARVCEAAEEARA